MINMNVNAETGEPIQCLRDMEQAMGISGTEVQPAIGQTEQRSSVWIPAFAGMTMNGINDAWDWDIRHARLDRASRVITTNSGA
jgi:hypothetical protein